MKKLWKKLISKSYAIGTGALIALTPTATFAAAPSSYVNKISDSLFGEILKVAPKVALVVIGFAVIMYLVSGDEHKKSKYRGTAVIALITLLILIVLKPLVTWFSGLI
ncbi:hypothetical protein [Bacillus xiapuensis]|uniref:TrbC/VIRB2 family protein n=1 Tax=Bacillus xiapuensis TaxID=2014075 RepID=A0ABU6N5K7_9BACI|nr:hypothetical protein [Bacillus xiapuensis]